MVIDASARELRAADADRQAAAERLGGAVAEGRLDLDEYEERLQHAYAARTYGELDRLLADLPPTPAPEPPRASPAITARSLIVKARRGGCCW